MKLKTSFQLIETPHNVYTLRIQMHTPCFEMFCDLKRQFVIFLLVFSLDCYSLPTLKTSQEDLLFNILQGCLTLVGVDSKKVHQRNSGITYNELNWQWNTLNGYLQPLAYIVPTDVSDVQKSVVCCRLSKVRIVARSGGHSYVKNGFGDSRSLVVDLTKLNQISLDPNQMTCEIGAGARLGRITYVLWKNGNFLIPSGICPTVGIAGLTLGGGYGRFTTLLGLTSDNVIEMEMVDARGQLLLINNSTNCDLFWALRGGGGGNFGIVTKFKFKMHSAPTSIVYGLFEYNFKEFSRFYKAWQLLITSDTSGHFAPIVILKDDRIKMGLLSFNFRHQNETKTSDMTSFLSLFPFPIAVYNATRVLSYPELMVSDGHRFPYTSLTNFSQLETISRDSVVGWKKVKSIISDEILNENQISQLEELLSDYLQHSELYFEPGGGAVNTVPISDTAFIHRRKNIFQIQLSVFTAQNERPNLNAVHAMTTFYEKSKLVFNHQESYQNYLDQDIDDYLKRYYGTNLKRLIQIKQKFDPDNVFHHPQSIPVNFVMN